MSVKIYNAQIILEALRIVNILEESGIKAYTVDAKDGITMHSMSGFGVYGVDVFIDEADEDEAMTILTRIKSEYR